MSEDILVKPRAASFRIPQSSGKPSKNCSQEDSYRQRALSFLRSITTGSTNNSTSSIMPEPLQLIPSENTHNLGITRNQEEDAEISKIQAWVISGVIKKSYKHCLELNRISIPDGRPLIKISEYPGNIVASPIKDKLNEEFSYAHPHLEPRLTLSKLSNLREDLIVKVWKTCGFDPVTLAVGFTCFDKLLDMNLVNKMNRKLYAAVCVLLAFKFMEETHLDEYSSKKTALMEKLYYMDKKDLLSSKMIFEAEFMVYAYLNFSMHFEYQEIEGNLKYIKARLIN